MSYDLTYDRTTEIFLAARDMVRKDYQDARIRLGLPPEPPADLGPFAVGGRQRHPVVTYGHEQGIDGGTARVNLPEPDQRPPTACSYCGGGIDYVVSNCPKCGETS